MSVKDSVSARVPLFSLGSGVLPLSRWSKKNKSDWVQILNNASAISVRGFQSSRILERITGRHDVYVTGDFALAASEIWGKEIRNGSVSRAKRIGINVGSHKLYSDSAHNLRLRDQIGTFMKNRAREFEFVPVYLHSIDEKRTKQVFKFANLPIKNEMALSRDGNSLPKMGRLDMIISERLHGSILAHSYDVPAIGIGYDEKVMEHFDVMDQAEFQVNPNRLSSWILEGLVEQILGGSNEIRKGISSSRAKLRKEQDGFVELMRSEICRG